MITIQYIIVTTSGPLTESFRTFEGATVYHLKYYIGYPPFKLGVFTELAVGGTPLGNMVPLVDGETYYVLQHGTEYDLRDKST